MKNIFYVVIVIVVLGAGFLLFMLVDNDKKDMMSSVSDIMENPNSLTDNMSMNLVSKTIGSVSESVSNMGNKMQHSLSTAVTSSAPNILQNSTSAIYKNGHFAVGYQDGSLEVINSSGDKKQFVFHTKKINNLYIVEDRLITSSDDGSLSVININTLSMIKQMKGHGKSVEGIVAFGNLIFSISKDRTIKIWEIYSTGLARIINY